MYSESIHIGDILNDEKIESLAYGRVLEKGYENWIHGNNYASWYSADGDPEDSFKNSIAAATKWHFAKWERDHEYKDVTSKVEYFLQGRLQDEGFYPFPIHWKRKDGTTEIQEPPDRTFQYYGMPISHKPRPEFVTVSKANIKAINQCISDAGEDVAWSQAESLQLFLQTTNPLCWNNESPQKLYGKGWIRDDKTRVLIIQHRESISELQYNRCLYRRHTLCYNHGYLTEYDRNGDEYQPWLK